MIDDADAVARADLGDPFEQLDDLSRSESSATGMPSLESDLDLLARLGGLLGGRHQLEDIVIGRVLEVLDPASLR